MQDLAASRSSGSARSDRRIGFGVGLALGLTLLLSTGGAAWGKKRVVVLGFDGAKAASAESAVADIVERKHTLVSASVYARAAKRLKARKSTDKNVAKIAKEISVDAIVVGSVKRKGNRWTLSVTVREGKTGKVMDTLIFRLSSPKVGKSDKQNISGDLLPLIKRTKSVAAAEEPKKKKKKKRVVEEEEEEEEFAEADPEPEDEEAPVEEAPVEEVASAEPAEETRIDSRRGETEPGATMPRVPGSAADASVGMSFIRRNLGFNHALAMAQAPPTYGGDPVPGIYVNAMVYPFAFVQRRGAARNLGISLVFDRVFTLTSNGRDLNDGMDKSFPTVQQRWGLGLKYRATFGSATVIAGIGYNRLAFEIDRGGADLDLPNVAYEYVDVGAQARFGAGRLGFFAGGAYLVMLATGEIQETTFYGGGTVQGVEVEGGIDVRISARLSGKVGFRYQRIAYDFDGSGMETTMRDGDAMDQDVGGALDEYVGGYATIGYLW